MPSQPTLSIATPVLAGVSRAVLIAAAIEAFREAATAPIDGHESGRIVVAWIPESRRVAGRRSV
jgi:hypothetical protein